MNIHIARGWAVAAMVGSVCSMMPLISFAQTMWVPHDLQASPVSPTEVDLTWDAIPPVAIYPSYEIYRCVGVGCTPTAFIAAPAPGTDDTVFATYKDQTVTAGKTYRYAIASISTSYKTSAKSSIVSILVPTVVTPPKAPSSKITCTQWGIDMRMGASGAPVASLQMLLISKGYDIPLISKHIATPGTFGMQTATALSNLQAKNSLLSTRELDASTRNLLNSCAINPAVPSSTLSPMPTATALPSMTPVKVNPTPNTSPSTTVTPTPSHSPKPTTSTTPTPTQSPTATYSPSPTYTYSPSVTPTASPTQTSSPTVTPTPSSTP